MRVAALCDPNLGNANYRSYQPLAALERGGRHQIHYNRRDKPVSLATLGTADVVHVHRIAEHEMRRVAQRLRESGVGLVWDDDDDVTAIPKSNPLYRQLGGMRSRERGRDIRAMVQLADVVTTPSVVLATRYRELGASDVRVLENYLPRQFGKTRRAKHDGIVVVYHAALEHQVDYQQLRLADTLSRLLDTHSDLRVRSYCLGLGLRSDRYEQLPTTSFPDLAQTLAHADIGIAPLIDIPWNRARSNVKVKEYAAGGLAWLASPVGPYVGMGEPNGGRLVPDGGWYAALEQLIVDARARRKLSRRASRWVKGEGIDRHVGLWESALQDAAHRARERHRSSCPNKTRSLLGPAAS